MWSLHTRAHHSAVKRREALTLAATWTDLENMMLSERSQTQKDTVCDSIDGKCPEQANPQTQKKWVSGCWELGEGEWRGSFFWGDGMFWN